MSSERALQAAIVALLDETPAYMALLNGGVHDGEAPDGTAMPYTIIGEMTENLNRTHDLDGYEHTVTIHDYSSYSGRKECQEIREARNTALQNAQLTPVGWGLTKLTYEFGDVMKEFDAELGKWVRHQVTRYRTHSLRPAT